MPDTDSSRGDPRLSLDTSCDPPVLELRGAWIIAAGLPDAAGIVSRLSKGSDLSVRGGGVERWDTSIAAFLRSLEQAVSGGGGRLLAHELPAGAERLLGLMRRSTAPARADKPRPRLVVAVGQAIAHRFQRIEDWMAIAGLTVLALARFVAGRARVPMADFLEQLVECGPRALPIVTLLSFLIGGWAR